jgi:hypothetical protein
MPPSRAHRKADMPTRSRADFENQDEWLSYVHDCVPVAEREYALACGRTDLFKSFYELRKREFPVEYIQELGHIQTLSEPDRTDGIERLNGRIFANMTELLFRETQPKQVESSLLVPVSPKGQVQELLDHLGKKNPYFSLWVVYKRELAKNSDAQDWERYLSQELGPENEDGIAFAKAMADLDKLLLYFRDHNMPLPRFFFERTWFLHSLRSPERMLQTRALLSVLASEAGECTYA